MPDPTMPSPDPSGPRTDPLPPDQQDARSRREYGHSSEDRNTRSRENDWPGFEGGAQRDATPGAPGEVSREKP